MRFDFVDDTGSAIPINYQVSVDLAERDLPGLLSAFDKTAVGPHVYSITEASYLYGEVPNSMANWPVLLLSSCHLTEEVARDLVDSSPRLVLGAESPRNDGGTYIIWSAITVSFAVDISAMVGFVDEGLACGGVILAALAEESIVLCKYVMDEAFATCLAIIRAARAIERCQPKANAIREGMGTFGSAAEESVMVGPAGEPVYVLNPLDE
jgi:hypothetical protein